MLKYELIAQVLKIWRADPEERALAEALLHVLQLDLADMQKLTVQELRDVLIETIGQSEKQIHGKHEEEESKEKSTKESLADLLEENGQTEEIVEEQQEEILIQEQKPDRELPALPKEELLKELNKRRGRKKNV